MDGQARRVGDNGSNSTQRLLLESVLGHVLLKTSTSDPGVVPEWTLVEFAGDAKLGGPGDPLEGKGCRPAGPRPAEGTGWQEPYEILKGQMQSPALGKQRLRQRSRLGTAWPGSSSAGKALLGFAVAS